MRFGFGLDFAPMGGGRSAASGSGGFIGSTTIPETTAAGASLGSVAVVGGTGPWTYSITAGNGAGKFSIVASTGEIKLAATIDYETVTSYTLTISITNGFDDPIIFTLTMNVGNVDEAAAEVWSASDKNADFTVTNSGRTATRGAAGGQAVIRSTRSHSTGKYHVECKIDTKGSFLQVGFTSAVTPLNAYLGTADRNSVALSSSHFIYFNGANNPLISNLDFNSGDVIVVEIDFDAAIVRFKNFTQSSAWTSDFSIAGATNQPWFLALESDSSAGSVVTLNTGQQPYSVQPTVGFGDW